MGAAGYRLRPRTRSQRLTRSLPVDAGDQAPDGKSNRTYDIPDGATKTIVVKLNQVGRSKLKKAGKLKAFLVFREKSAGQKVSTGTRFPVKFKKERKRKQARPRPAFVGIFPAPLQGFTSP